MKLNCVPNMNLVEEMKLRMTLRDALDRFGFDGFDIALYAWDGKDYNVYDVHDHKHGSTCPIFDECADYICKDITVRFNLGMVTLTVVKEG